MSKRKKYEDVDELFVKKLTRTSETKTIALEIPEFLKKIAGNETVTSPKFRLAGVEFCIFVKPGTRKVLVGLVNCNIANEDQTASVTFTEESGKERIREMDKVSVCCVQFMSHEEYKAWAKDHGDVFKLKARVTLHQEINTAEGGWIRYVVNSVSFVFLGFNYNVQDQAQAGAQPSGDFLQDHPE